MVVASGGASQDRAATCASLPGCKHPRILRRLFNVLEQRLCRTLYALSRNSGTLRVSVDYLYLAATQSSEAMTLTRGSSSITRLSAPRLRSKA